MGLAAVRALAGHPRAMVPRRPARLACLPRVFLSWRLETRASSARSRTSRGSSAGSAKCLGGERRRAGTETRARCRASLANDANDSSDVLMRDVDEPTTVTLGHSSSSSNIHELDPGSAIGARPARRAPERFAARVLVTAGSCSGGVRPPRGGGRTAPHALHRGGRRGEATGERRPDRRRTHELRDVPPEGVRRRRSLAVERRVATYAGLPYENQEQLQLLRYRDGQEYKDHNDGLTSPENGGKRVATVLMFLHEPTKGRRDEFSDGQTVRARRRANEIGSRSIRTSSRNARGETGEGYGGAAPPRRRGACSFPSTERRSVGSREHARTLSHHPEGRSGPPRSGSVRRLRRGRGRRPACEDKERRCGDWAAAGECAKNPGFMLGTEVAGSCLKSCCAGRWRCRRR